MRAFLLWFYMLQLQDPPLKIIELLNIILYGRFVLKNHQNFQSQTLIIKFFMTQSLGQS